MSLSPENPFSIRPATPEDCAQLAEIEKRVQASVPWTEAQFIAELEKPYARVWIITDDETDSQIMGYISVWLLDQNLQILNLGVPPEFRRRGMAKILLRAAVNEAVRNEMKRAVLEVRKSNLPAITLYQGLRFTIDQIRKEFYQNGEDAYVMSLPLDGDEFEGF